MAQEFTPEEVAARLTTAGPREFTPEEVAERLGSVTPRPIRSKERSWGDAALDVPAVGLSGVGSLLRVPGQLIKLAPGLQGVGEALEAPGKAIAEFGEGLKSEGLKVREALRSEAISEAEKEGILAEFVTALKYTIKDPALLSSFFIEQLPLLIGPAGAAKAVQIAGTGAVRAAGKGLTGEAAELATKEAAERLGKRATGAAVGAGTAMQTADIASETFDRAYDVAIKQGMSKEEANDAALNAARLAAPGAALTSLIATKGLAKLGGAAIERRLAGLPGTGRLRTAGGEAASEGLEEAGGALAGNIGVRTVDPTQSLTAGVGSAAGLGVLGGGVLGGVLGGKAKPELAPGQLEGENLYQTARRLHTEIGELDALAEKAKEQENRQLVELKTDAEVANLYRTEGVEGVERYQKELLQKSVAVEATPEEREQAKQASSAATKLMKQIDTSNVIAHRDLMAMGVSQKDRLYKELIGKDMVADSSPIINSFAKALSRPDLSQQQRENISAALTNINEYVGSGGVDSRNVGESVRRSLGLVGVAPERPAARGVEGTAPAGVAPTEEYAGEPLGRAAVKPSPIGEDIEKAPRAAPTAPITEEVQAPPAAPAAEAVARRDPTQATEESAVERFAPEEVEKARVPDYKSRERLIEMPIDEFLQLADTVYKRERLSFMRQKMDNARDLVRRNVPFSSLPMLMYSDGRVDGHEGRHRALALREAGYKTMPVRLRSSDIRWDRQNDPSDRDYIRQWPTRLQAQENAANPNFSIPFPVKREDSARPYEPVKRSLKPETEKRAEEILRQQDEEERQPKQAPETAEPVAEKTRVEQFAEARKDLVNQLDGVLKRILAKYGLKDVKLNINEAMQDEGSYARQIITLALNVDNPIRVLRHESIHALKDMGFFAPAQWNALVKRANEEWIDVLKNTVYNEATGASRYDAYQDLFAAEGANKGLKGDALTKYINESIVEEAIADAFGAYDTGKPPAGMIAATLTRMRKLFKAIKEAFGIVGIDTAEDVFGKIEEGKLKPTLEAKQISGKLRTTLASGERDEAIRPEEPAVRPSLRGEKARPAAERGGDRGRREEGRVIAPLAGAPIIEGATGPDPRIVSVAEKYAADRGIPFKRQGRYVTVDEDRARQIAAAYEAMPHAPQEPKVKEAYRDLIDQTRDQYDALIDAGYEFTFFDSDTDPYDGNPWNAMRDLRQNQRMAVYGTYDGYGTEGITGAAVEDNPMLADTGLRWKDQNGKRQVVTANDLFRAVHDAFGHGLEGAGFRAQGEENAWQAHARLFTGPAVGAITSETRGQNSWLNFGPYGDKNRTAKIEDTVFAEQKTGLMPEWTWQDGLVESEPTGVVLGSKQPGAASFKGVHYGNVQQVEELNAEKYGTGLRGAERSRLDRAYDDRIKKRVYFYIERPDGTMPVPEAGVGGYVYTQTFDNILPPGAEMSTLFREANGDFNTFESLVVDAGYDGYAVSSMGMMVVLNHNAPVQYLGPRTEVKFGLETPKSMAKPSLRVMRGEEKPKLKGKPSVNTVGKYFDDQILEEFGRQLDYNNPEDFARAVKIASDEVAYQLKKEKSGLDWYEEDVKEAFKQTAKIIPELKKTDNRLLFSVMAGIMSPQTNARDNWFIAAKAFQHYVSTGTIPGMNPENGKLWQGGTQSANKKVQLDFLNKMVEDMGQKKALEWLFSDHTVKEINEFRSKYGNIKSGIDGKLTDIKPGLYAFGPKVGPFVSNLNGIHDVTVDKWMTRTFNRYFGTMVDANGEIIDAPTEPQRRAVKQLVNEVAEDAGIKPYQVQSLLWFYEQRLFTEMGVPSPSYGFSDGGKKFFDDARGRGGEPSGGAASEAVEPKRLSLRTFKDLFDKAADIPQSEGVEIIRENWIGGVSGIGERNSAYDLPRVQGGRQYMNDVQDLIRNELGDTFKGYRLMHVDELEEIMSGSMGSDLASFTLLPEVAQKFSSVAAFRDIPRDQLAVVEMNLTPEHIWMFGHRGEREVVVNYGEGYSTAEVIATPLEGEKLSLRTPETPQFKFWFGNSKVVDENGEPKVMYHGTGKDYEILSTARRAAGAIFVSDEPQFAEKFAKDTFARASAEAATGVGIDDEAFKQGVDKAIAQIRKDYGRDPMGRTLVAEVRKGYNEANAEAQEYLRNAFKDVMPAGPNIIPVYIKSEYPFDYENDEHVAAVRRVSETKLTAEALKTGNWEAIEDNEIQAAIRVLGFDGFYVKEQGKRSLGVYDPNQVKSVFNEAPTERPELRMSLRGSITPQLEKTLNKIVPKTYRPNRFQRILDSISGDGFTAARAQILNRYEALARLDRAVAQQIKQAGGIQQLADQKAESAALFSDLGAGLLETAMGAHDRWGGAPVFRNGMTTISNFGGKIKGPIRIFKPLSDLKDPDAFRMYQLWSSVKRGKRLTVEGRESAIDAADIVVVDAFATDPRNANIVKLFERVQKDWLAYNDALVKFMEDTGVISKAMGKAFTEHGDYFPFYRLANDQDVVGPKMFTSIGNVKPPKKLKGGEAPLGDFFENIVLNSRAAIQAGIKNVASQRATEQALRVQGVVRLASQPTVKQTGANSWDVFDGNLKIGEVDAGSLQDAQLAADRQHKRPSSIQINMYRVMEKGNEVFYRSADPLFIDALKSLNMPDLPFLGALFSGPANLLRNLVTKDPAFMLANMMRDSLAAYVTTGVNMTPVVDTLKNFTVAIAGKSPEMQRLYAAGVLGGYDYSVKSKDAAATFEKRLREVSGTKTIGETLATPFTSLWGALEKGTQASDAATRIEMYKKTLAKTGNEAEAYWQALEVMNFNRHGSNPVVRIMTAAIPFLNARMQGLDLLYRKAIYPIYGKDATDAEIQNMKTFWVRGMTMASLSVLYWMMVHDDEDYKSQEQETRDNYWFVPGLGIKLPIPFEIGVLFKVIPERIAELAWGEDTSKDFRESMTRNLINTFRINPIPQAVLPLYETIVDKSLYTGRAIVSRGMENIAPEYQIGPNTSRIAEVAGKAVGYSPMKIDHLIRGYTGTLGQYMADLIGAAYEVSADNPKPSKRIEQLPVIRRFATDPEARGKLTAFYELKNAVDEAVRTSNMLEKTMQLEELIKYQEDNAQILAMQDYIKDLDKSLKELRDTRKEILSMPMDPDDKRDTLVSIGQMERMLVDNIKDLRAMAFK